MRGYALVTGASEGIGYAIAAALAERDYGLILVARNEERLRHAGQRLQAQSGVDVVILPCDLSAPGAAEHVHQQVTAMGLDVRVLVNNAGLLFNGYFTDIPWAGQQQLLACNIVALTGLCHFFARHMAEKGGGHILNVASTAAWVAIPNQNVYAASKAYVLSFSHALANELKAAKTGVTVTALCPSYTATNMLTSRAQGKVMQIPQSMILSPEFVANRGVDACLKGRNQCIPGWSNYFSMMFVQWLPKTWVAGALGYCYRKAQGVQR